MTIHEVWEKHGHLDYLFSDREWMAGGDCRLAILFDCWQAIRGHIEAGGCPFDKIADEDLEATMGRDRGGG